MTEIKLFGIGEASSRGNQPVSAQMKQILIAFMQGVVRNVPELEEEAYRQLRSVLIRAISRIESAETESEVASQTTSVLEELANYHTNSLATIHDRTMEWRRLSGMLLSRLGGQGKSQAKRELWGSLLNAIGEAVTSSQIEALRNRVRAALQSSDQEEAARRSFADEPLNQSVSNDNAAGLPGGGLAVEHLARLLREQKSGYVAFFHLSCLDVIGQRFGVAGIQDCLMTVSSFLMSNLSKEDAIYHWSDSTLVTVSESKAKKEIMLAELQRILALNRDFTIEIDNRRIMLRIPIDLDLYPVSEFASAEDLLKLSGARHVLR